MTFNIKKAILALALAPFVTQAVIDKAERDVTIYVIVPQEVPLTVASGHSFRDAATEFCDKNGLNLAMVSNITRGLEMKYEQMKIVKEPLISVGVSLTRKKDEASESFDDNTTEEALMHLYEGDAIFDSVYRFCLAHNLDIYYHGRTLEGLMLAALRNITAQMNSTALTGTPQIAAQVAEITDKPMVELTTSRPGVLPQRVEQAEAANPTLNTTRFKLFSLPVKVDDQDIELEFYNGDRLNEKIHDFCETYGLNETVAKQPLVDAVMKYTQAIQDKFPNSVWFESL